MLIHIYFLALLPEQSRSQGLRSFMSFRTGFAAFLFLFIFGIVSISPAQGFDTVYFDNNWMITSKNDALYARTSGFVSSPPAYDSMVTDYYLTNHQVEMTGQYNNGSKNGEFVFYYVDGTVKMSIHFKDNIRSGRWTAYYPNGQTKIEVDYGDGMEKLLGYYDTLGNSLLKKDLFTFQMNFYDIPDLSYFDGYFGPDDQIEINGNIKNQLREGNWKINKNGTPYARLKYKEGRLKKGYVQFERERLNLLPENSLVFPLINIPKKFFVTELHIRKPGATIKNNYVINALHRHEYISMNKIDLDSKEDLIEYINSKFDLRSRKTKKTIKIIIYTADNVPFRVATKPEISPKSLAELNLIVQTIQNLNFICGDMITFDYEIELLDK